MGHLADFDLGTLMAQTGCRYLVETGTGGGANLDHAKDFPFAHVFAIEPNHKLALDVALRNSKRQDLTVINARTEKGLREALEEIPAEAAVLFSLNAHAADKHPGPQLCLERELRLLAGLRDLSGDVFLISQLRLYEAGEYDDGPAAEPLTPATGLGFVDELLAQTHRLERLSRRAGFLCAFPLKG